MSSKLEYIHGFLHACVREMTKKVKKNQSIHVFPVIKRFTWVMHMAK